MRRGWCRTLGCHLVKSADPKLWGFQHIELRWPFLLMLGRPPGNLHPPGNDESMKDVNEHKMDAVVKPEDCAGRHTEPQTD